MFMAHNTLLSTRFFTPSKFFLMVAKSSIILSDKLVNVPSVGILNTADASAAKLTSSAPLELRQDPFS